MSLSTKQLKDVQRIILIAERQVNDIQGLILSAERQLKDVQEVISVAETILQEAVSDGRITRRRVRRAGKELDDFRRTLAEERKHGVPVSEIARKYGVTASYVYQLK